ncbi:putative esterase [Actinomadura rupiterrae]|nr:prolyl oligopeptidase family serine peptidase [Actinomadura rupiterrae]MCP2342154.1 putative esterase [Actinomadura rupiterrae]
MPSLRDFPAPPHPAEPGGTVVVVPGRGVAPDWYRWIAEAAVSAGWDATLVTGLYDEDDDDRGGPRAYRTVTDLVRAAGLPDDRLLVAVGHSTGARVALHLGRALPVAGIAALCPIADFADHVQRARAFLPDYTDQVIAALGAPDLSHAPYRDRSPITWLDELDAALLLVGCEHDRVCPPYQTEALRKAASALGLPVRCEIVPRAGHFFETSAATTSVRAEVSALLIDWLGDLTDGPRIRMRNSAPLLGSHVRGRPEHLALRGQRGRLGQPGDAEIKDLRPAVHDHDVRRLDVPVDDGPGVCVRQRLRYADRQIPRA